MIEGYPSTQVRIDLTEFERRLHGLVSADSQLRPFVCEGSPLECSVFIVGFNPTTTMDAGFRNFWRPGVCFDKKSWFEASKQDRLSRPVKPAKTRRLEVSNSRLVIEWILKSSAPVRCLETNIYAAPTDQMSDLATKMRLTEPFDFLLETIRPQLIVAHGADASRYCEERTLEATVITVTHFSRGWSQKAANELGITIRQHVERTRRT